MTALPNKHYSGHCMATETQGNHGTPGKRDLEKEMGTAGFRYSWRKTEAAAQNRTERRQLVCDL